MSTLEVVNLSKTYGADHLAVHAVRDVSFQVAAGEVVVVMGRSGSGKTTLLTLIGSLLRPTAGDVRLDGRSYGACAERELAALRLRRIGFVFQDFNLLSALTAEQNVAVPLLAGGMRRRHANESAHHTLDRLGLAARSDHLPSELSGGERQRVALARALVMEPSLLLADEPTANLDSLTGRAVAELLCTTACAEGRAVVIVTHDELLVEIAHRVLRMQDGAIVSNETGMHDQHCPHCMTTSSAECYPP